MATKKFKQLYLPLILFSAFSCTNETIKNNSSENIKDTAITKTTIAVVSTPLIEKLQGTWINANSKDDHSQFTFEIKGDTLFHISNNEKYKITIAADSSFSEVELLSKQASKTIEPKMSIPIKIYKLTEDSLIFWNWQYSNQKQSRYYKKKT
jgi:hypothetical protein